MRRFLFIIFPFCAVLLAGCAKSEAITYAIVFNTENAGERQELVTQAIRVVERRLGSMGADMKDSDVDTSSGGQVSLTVEVSPPEAIDTLTEQLVAPFKLRIMGEAPPEQAQLTVEGHGGFKETGITEKDLIWANAREQGTSGKAEVRLVFTEEGRKKMSTMFRTMKGKTIGIFVRDKLVSKHLVDTDTLKDDIVIQDIPSVDLAEIFVDDLNVGLHIVFQPVQ